MDLRNNQISAIKELLAGADSETLERVLEFLRSCNDPIIGYRTDGTPIRKKEMLEQIEQSMQEYREGKSITLDQLEKESESWLDD